MIDSDRPKFARLILGGLSAYPTLQVGEGTVHAYWWLLRAYDYDLVERALRLAILDSPTFAPTASQVHERARILQTRRVEQRREERYLRITAPPQVEEPQDREPKTAAGRQYRDELLARWRTNPPWERTGEEQRAAVEEVVRRCVR